MTHDELEELFESIQAYYLELFERAIAKYEDRNIILEPALRDSNGEIAMEGRLNLPTRVDLVILDGIDRSPISSIDIETNSRIDFPEMNFSFEGADINVVPFSWDWVAIRSDMMIGHADQVVKGWFADAFEEKEGLVPPFFGCAHFIAEPTTVDGNCEFQLDAGSCPADVVMALVDQMIGAGAKKISIG